MTLHLRRLPTNRPALRRLPTNRPAECRLCGDLSWLVDEAGPVHACCVRWAADLAAGKPCPSCETSKAFWRRQSNRGPRG